MYLDLNFSILIFAPCLYNIYLMNIKKVIKDKGWTMEQLASKMKNKQGTDGISQSSVSQLINGNPTIDKLQEIANIIGVSLSELVADDEEQVIKCPNCGAKIKITIEE